MKVYQSLKMSSKIAKIECFDKKMFFEEFPKLNESFFTDIRAKDYSVLDEIEEWVDSKEINTWSKTAKKFMTDFNFFEPKKTTSKRKGKLP